MFIRVRVLVCSAKCPICRGFLSVGSLKKPYRDPALEAADAAADAPAAAAPADEVVMFDTKINSLVRILLSAHVANVSYFFTCFSQALEISYLEF